MVHPDLFQGRLRVSEHTVGFAKDVPILLRQGIEKFLEEFDTDLTVHDLLRRSGEQPRHQPLIGIALIVLRDKVMHTEEMSIVTNIPVGASRGDVQFLCNFVGIFPCDIIQLLRLPNTSHLVFT